MKIEELSIGDWVRLKNYDIDCKILGCGIRIEIANSLLRLQSEIACVQIGKMNDLRVSISQLEPIPLTPEILEKNGWVHCGPCHWRNRDIKCSCFRFGRKYWDIHIRGGASISPNSH